MKGIKINDSVLYLSLSRSKKINGCDFITYLAKIIHKLKKP